MLLFAVLVVVMLRVRPRVPPELVTFALAIGFFAFTSQTLGFRPRFVMTAFPLFIGLGVALRRTVPFAVVLATSASLLMVLSVVTLTTKYVTP
jgi:hypothetical protein